MTILFITGLYPIEKIEYFRNNTINNVLQFASNEYQWRIVEGLQENDINFHVISCPFLSCYPKYKDVYSSGGTIKYKNKAIGEYLNYCTIPILKYLSLVLRLRRSINKYLKSNANNDTYIITYNSLGFMQEAIKPLKKKYNIKLCSIITDLIDDATNPIFKLSFLKYIQARMEQERIWKSYKYTDGFILLSKYMVEYIPQAINKNIVIEGISKSTILEDIKLKKDEIKTIIYTGILAEFAGIKNLLNAFMNTKKNNYRLIICGSGELKNYVKECTKKDSRIIYKGSIPHDEVVKLQTHATIVINPRLPTVSLTKYSFPSKTIEYLLSGTPMIGYQLTGIPDEYYDYFYTPNDYTIESLTETINMVMEKSPEELKEKAVAARMFILDNKTSKKQIYKIISFLKTLS